MLHKPTVLLLTGVLLLACALTSLAQDKTDLKIGDTVYVNASYGGCVKATVTRIRESEPVYKYVLHIEEGTYKGQDTITNIDRVRDCGAAPAQKGQTADQLAGAPAQNPGAFKVGDLVDVYLSDGKTGKSRGMIIEIGDHKYKVHYDGCKDYWDEWVNEPLVRPAATISADAPEIKFLVGRWGLTTVGLSSVAVAWGKSPGVQINGDGTYIWYQGEGKAPVRGKWAPHAKIESARNGTETKDGLIVKDATGGEWKVYRRKALTDNEDHITVERMCSGETKMGTRVR
jgi:hypothetical protein